jgi:FHS family L-fucose permease-like MFS transporter
MAIVGGAVMAPLMGWVITKIGFHNGFLFPGLCYLYVMYYGISGYKIKPVSS